MCSIVFLQSIKLMESEVSGVPNFPSFSGSQGGYEFFMVLSRRFFVPVSQLISAWVSAYDVFIRIYGEDLKTTLTMMMGIVILYDVIIYPLVIWSGDWKPFRFYTGWFTYSQLWFVIFQFANCSFTRGYPPKTTTGYPWVPANPAPTCSRWPDGTPSGPRVDKLKSWWFYPLVN
jgi:hypothetical protein